MAAIIRYSVDVEDRITGKLEDIYSQMNSLETLAKTILDFNPTDNVSFERLAKGLNEYAMNARMATESLATDVDKNRRGNSNMLSSIRQANRSGRRMGRIFSDLGNAFGKGDSSLKQFVGTIGSIAGDLSMGNFGPAAIAAISIQAIGYISNLATQYKRLQEKTNEVYESITKTIFVYTGLNDKKTAEEITTIFSYAFPKEKDQESVVKEAEKFVSEIAGSYYGVQNATGQRLNLNQVFEQLYSSTSMYSNDVTLAEFQKTEQQYLTLIKSLKTDFNKRKGKSGINDAVRDILQNSNLFQKQLDSKELTDVVSKSKNIPSLLNYLFSLNNNKALSDRVKNVSTEDFSNLISGAFGDSPVPQNDVVSKYKIGPGSVLSLPALMPPIEEKKIKEPRIPKQKYEIEESIINIDTIVNMVTIKDATIVKVKTSIHNEVVAILQSLIHDVQVIGKF